MKEYFNLRILKNAELILRLTMLITLLIAGVSKFFSNGNFYVYYLKQFSNQELRINLPTFTFDFYLSLIPYLEVAIAIALLTSIKRRFFIIVCIAYFISLELGHYVLEEFTSANMIIPYIFLGVLTYILPAHKYIWKLDNEMNDKMKHQDSASS
ncbi:MAG: hypothetical protein ACKVOQ_14965 [Cyclobacteriaceae bacterium]